MEFDLYKLAAKDGKASVKAILTDDIKQKLRNSIIELRKNTKYIDFCKSIGISYETFWDYSNRRKSVPLFLLKELDRRFNVDFTKDIDFIELGAGLTKVKIKSVKHLTENLAKIIGAYAADGSLRKRETIWNGKVVTHYELVFVEGHKTNIDALCSWINSVFGICVNPTKKENHYRIYISNKLIYRYFTEIFGFDSGRKTETIFVPDFIKNSEAKIKRSFITGVLMFDGSVGYRNGYIELCSKSKRLIEDMVFLLKDICVTPDYLSLKPDGFGRYSFKIRKFDKLKKSLQFFEPETEKWFRLKEHIFGFDEATEDLNRLVTNVDKYYPSVRKGTTKLSDIIKIINDLESNGEKPDFKSISKILNRRPTVVYEYLRKMERLGILKTQREHTKKFWMLNTKLPLPKRGC